MMEKYKLTQVNSNSVNLDVLDFLRKNTVISPISLLKYKREQLIAKSKQKEYYKAEGERLEIDFSKADEVEYNLRLKAWEKSCYNDWKINGDGRDLSEYAMEIITQRINNNIKHSR